MISSMTGFSREAGSTGAFAWAWEIKSVNGRNLDVRVRVPPGFDASGEEARKIVSSAIVRGAVQVGLTIQRAEARKSAVRINRDVLMSVVDALKALPPDLAMKPATMDGLLQVRGVIEADEQDDQAITAELQVALLQGIKIAAASFVAARQQEGAALGGVLVGQLARMQSLVDAVEHHPARTVEAIRAKLQSQIAAIMAGGPSLDPARLHQEAALLATKADVREELDRLGAHITASKDLFAQGGAIGRKLDFLAQEFGREASTLCAKANGIALSQLGLELRAVVDQFREQAQNVE